MRGSLGLQPENRRPGRRIGPARCCSWAENSPPAARGRSWPSDRIRRLSVDFAGSKPGAGCLSLENPRPIASLPFLPLVSGGAAAGPSPPRRPVQPPRHGHAMAARKPCTSLPFSFSVLSTGPSRGGGAAAPFAVATGPPWPARTHAPAARCTAVNGRRPRALFFRSSPSFSCFCAAQRQRWPPMAP